MIKNITANYSVTIIFIYDASFFSYDTIIFIYDASFFLYDAIFFIYDASFFFYDTVFFNYDTVFFCLVMTYFLLDTVFISIFAIFRHFIAIYGILSIIPATHNAKFSHRNIIRLGNFGKMLSNGYQFYSIGLSYSILKGLSKYFLLT